ncbi:MAG: RNase adapter RapZ [Acidobacteriota bacterium]|nr:RNase adapter RapZ [Acidobacteriota bacterium]MDH3524939.1 RNase adapter RapZ [Acidobacteriota bacterium]
MTPRPRLVVITGLSGSGKSSVAKCFEDLGYYCVDNLPLDLLARFLERPFELTRARRGVAVVTDVRAPGFAERLPELLTRPEVAVHDPVLLFLEADDETLVRRFSETRRSHPIGDAPSLEESIRRERGLLSELRGLADRVFDTSEWTIHEARHHVRREFGPRDAREAGPVVTLMSFGFKHGIPYGTNLLFDVRFLANPYFDERLRALTGRDPEVLAFLDAEAEYHELLERLSDFLAYLLPKYADEQRSYVSIGVGCTGGRHRSVAVADALVERLEARGWSLRVSHRDLER